MNRIHIFAMSSVIALALISCQPNEEQQARAYINRGTQQIDNGEWNNALTTLDSVDILFPKLVNMRREARHLKDSIAYLQAQRSLEYNDAMLNDAEQLLDSLLQAFTLEKDTAYQKYGNLILPAMRSVNNSQRSFLQAFVSEDGHPFVRSVYCGSKKLNHTNLLITANDEANTEVTAIKAPHIFEGHEYLAFENDDAMNLLTFIDNHGSDKIKVIISGEDTYSYQLTANDIKALQQTCSLAIAYNDVNTLRHNANAAQNVIAKWQQNNQ